jgi:hypothetical protein
VKPDGILIPQYFPEMGVVSTVSLVGDLPFTHAILNKRKDFPEGIYG